MLDVFGIGQHAGAQAFVRIISTVPCRISGVLSRNAGDAAFCSPVAAPVMWSKLAKQRAACGGPSLRQRSGRHTPLAVSSVAAAFG